MLGQLVWLLFPSFPDVPPAILGVGSYFILKMDVVGFFEISLNSYQASRHDI